ncbi:hypothetical protein ACIBI9_55880 [Nonomuraea sp. NPDC050451]|uniref:hypothetical protein n=1 Tax=Nonomuraea sp. NPDC050451 TaxID=3364364 RepID=UPI003788D573
MLISRLLPGLREIRTPIAAGFIWLVLFALLLLGSNVGPFLDLSGIPPEEADKLPERTAYWTIVGRSLDNLQKVILNPLVATVLIFLAYLVGTVSTMVSNLVLALIDRIIALATRTSSDHLKFANLVRLIGREPELYELYERLRCEIEFRAGVSIPLVAMVIVLSGELGAAGFDAAAYLLVGLWWLFLMMIVLVIQAIGNRRRLGVVLREAISRLDQPDRAANTEQAPERMADQDQESLEL